MAEANNEEIKTDHDHLDTLRGRSESRTHLPPGSLADIPPGELVLTHSKKRRFSKTKFNKHKKGESTNELPSIEKRLFAKIFGRTSKNENVVNMDLLETQAGLDTRAQYGDVRDLMQTDATGRTMIHRAALEQNSKLLHELCEEAAKTSNKLAFIDRRDKFGNTPLLLSCLLNYPGSSIKRARCLEILLSHKADINVKNNRTMWTAVMWCSYYGDEKGLRKLLEEKAKCYSPDYKGFFPFDWAGLKGHRKCIEILLEKLMNDIENIEKTSGEEEKYLRSPLLRSSLLYWACYYKFDLSIIQKLMSFNDVIPEFPINCVQNKTSIHACCEVGYKEALDLLLESSKSTYEANSKIRSSYRMSTEMVMIVPKTDRQMLPLTKEEKRKFKKKFLKALQTASTWFSTYLARVVAGGPASYLDCKDRLGNTPLHLASYYGNDSCALTLLKLGANIDSMNNEGWMCKELQKHETIQKLYDKETSENLKQEVSKAIAMKVGIGLISLARTSSALAKRASTSSVYPESSPKSKKSETKIKLAMHRADTVLRSDKTIFHDPPIIPDVVIKFKIEDGDSERKQFYIKRMDFYMQILTQTSFEVFLAPGIHRGVYLVMLKMDDQNLSKECSQLGLKMKLLNSYLHQPYDDSRRTEFEPFRSFQRQEVAINVLKKFIDLDLLKSQKVVVDYCRMHTVAGLQKIRDIWITNSKWYWPHPLNHIADFAIEDRNHNYPAITALKQYFGEKIAFYFAFSSFFTCYLFFLAVPGLVLQIYLLTRRFDSRAGDDPDEYMYNTPFVAVWVLYVLVWNTVTVERWKRKNAEIATRWGIRRSDDFSADSDDRVVRKDFIGDECVSGSTGALTKKYKVPVTTITFIASMPVLIVLLAGVVASFIFFTYVKNFGAEYKGGKYLFYFELLAGTANGVIISALNITYSVIARWFVKKENHKYQVDYERSLIFKSFAFRSLNSFIGVVYIAFVVKDSNLWNTFIYLLTLVFTKQCSSIATLSILPWLQYKLKQNQYFNVARRKALEQAAMERGSLQTMETEELEPKSPFNGGMFRRLSMRKPKTALSFKRPVLDLKQGLSNKTWELQQVELNTLRINFIDLVDSYGETFVLLGVITLFASAFPLGPLIALFNSIFDIRSRLLSFLNVFDRPAAQGSSGIGLWLQIWEFLSIASIFSNLILLYIHVEFGLQNVYIFDQSNDFSKLFIFVLAEHVVLLLKYILAVIIPDKPRWVVREEEKQKYHEDIELESMKAREQTNMSAADLKNQEKLLGLQDQLTAAIEALEKIKKEKGRADLTSTNKNPIKGSPSLELKLAVKSMLYTTFVVVERELILSRISNIADVNRGGLVVKCTSCSKKKAIIQCKQSRELVCKECYFNVQAKLNFADEIDILPYIGGTGEIDRDVLREVAKKRKEKSLSPGKSTETFSKWKKFEYFSFPTNPNNQTFQELSRIFNTLYKLYITESGIDYDNQIVDTNKFLRIKLPNSPSINSPSIDDLPLVNLRSPSFGQLRSPSEKGVFKGEIDRNLTKIYTEFIENDTFNDEEKLLLNRIAFLVFKRSGANATFIDFLRLVKSLQDGQFENKVYVLFDLLDEDDDGLISLTDLKRIARTSHMQSASLKDECEKILSELVPSKETLDKKTTIQLLLHEKKARDIFSSLLQAY